MTEKSPGAAVEVKKVFISHVSFEAGVASVLKEWIEKAFPRHVEVFVSATGMLAGSFSHRIEKELRESKVLLVLASKFSAGSTWVSFEAGFAKALDVPTIPIYSPPLSAGQLPPTLSQLQSRRLSAEGFPSQLIKDDLSGILGYSRRRGFSFKNMYKAIYKARMRLALMRKLMEAIRELDTSECTAPSLAKTVKASQKATKQALEDLQEGDYINDTLGVSEGEEKGFELTRRGRMLLGL